MNYIVNQLPPYLFWDSNPAKLDDCEHYEKIIIRTFELGDVDHIATVIAYYGRGLCSDVLKEAHYLRESAIIFGSAFLNINKEEFRSFSNIQHHPI